MKGERIRKNVYLNEKESKLNNYPVAETQDPRRLISYDTDQLFVIRF